MKRNLKIQGMELPVFVDVPDGADEKSFMEGFYNTLEQQKISPSDIYNFTDDSGKIDLSKFQMPQNAQTSPQQAAQPQMPMMATQGQSQRPKFPEGQEGVYGKPNILNALLTSYAEGLMPQTPNLARSGGAAIQAVLEMIRKEGDQKFSDEYKNQKQLEDLRAQESLEKYPISSKISEFAGALNPRSLFSKVFGVGGAVAKEASLLPKMGQYAVKGGLASGANQTMKEILNLINPDESIDAAKRIAGTGLSGAALSSVLGPTAEVLADKLKTPSGLKEILQKIKRKGEAPAPEQLGESVQSAVAGTKQAAKESFNKTFSKYGDAKVSNLNETKSAIAGMLQDAGVMSKTGARIEGVKPKGGYTQKEVDYLLSKFDELSPVKNPNAPKTVKELQDFKNVVGREIKEMTQTAPSERMNKINKQISNATKRDVIKTVGGEKTIKGQKVIENPNAQKEVGKAYSQYSSMKKNLADIEQNIGKINRVQKNDSIKVYQKIIQNKNNAEGLKKLKDLGVNPKDISSTFVKETMKVKPDGYLDIQKTYSALDDFTDAAAKEAFGSDYQNMIKLKSILKDYISAGKKEIKMPGEAGRTLEGYLKSKNINDISFGKIISGIVTKGAVTGLKGVKLGAEAAQRVPAVKKKEKEN